MALQLFEHNEKAYWAAIRMMEQYGKAAIIHPTGTGKSYIAFKLIEEHPDAVIFWLSPSEYIFKTQIENLKKQASDFPLANVHFYTYAKLMCCTEAQLAEIAALSPAYIILDEFHRVGAECWGESTRGLLKLCQNARLLGLTATNVRYLDNNRDMAEELFGGHIASEMTLGEAIVRGSAAIPAAYKTADGIWLGRWLYEQKKLLSSGSEKLSDQQRESLYELLNSVRCTDRSTEITAKAG